MREGAWTPTRKNGLHELQPQPSAVSRSFLPHLFLTRFWHPDPSPSSVEGSGLYLGILVVHFSPGLCSYLRVDIARINLRNRTTSVVDPRLQCDFILQ